MVISKHTPGPWNIHPAYEDDMNIKAYSSGDDSEPWVACEAYIARGETIVCKAEMRTSRNGWPLPRTRGEMIANANLIIAAPDMLEVLEWIDNEFDVRDDEFGGFLFTRTDIEKVRSIIKKARRGEVGE